MTLTEKLIASHAGGDRVRPGDLVNVEVDLALANDITAPGAISQFLEMGADKVFDPQKVVLVPDHFVPARDVDSAEQAKKLRDFAKEQGLDNYFELGRMGIEHALLPELGLVLPGDLVIGADSHTCTYGALGAFSTGMGSTDLASAWATGQIWLKVPASIKFVIDGELGPWVSGKDIILHVIGMIGVDGALYEAMEFTGSTIRDLSVDGRLTVCNMAIEAGAKNGVIAADQATEEWLAGKSDRAYRIENSDADAEYEKIFNIDAADIGLVAAAPHSPANVKPVEDFAGISVDQVVIGSCTNGRLEDLRVAAELLRGRQASRDVRLIIIPATQGLYAQAAKEGLIDVFIEAGGAVSTPTCGPCLGGHMGVLAAGERCVATTNRNFIGRMGHPESEVYLAGPAVAAASAIMGRVARPDEL